MKKSRCGVMRFSIAGGFVIAILFSVSDLEAQTVSARGSDQLPAARNVETDSESATSLASQIQILSQRIEEQGKQIKLLQEILARQAGQVQPLASASEQSKAVADLGNDPISRIPLSGTASIRTQPSAPATPAAAQRALRPAPSAPQKDMSVKVSGYLFGDYYWLARNHRNSLVDENGFWIRRAYLTFDKPLSESIDSRFRFEVNSAGDFASQRKMEPLAKDAWVRWKYAGNHRLILGLSPTPTWEVIERFWGYRSVEKSMLNLQRMGSSRDLGLALQGGLDRGQKIRYHFMFANGSGTGSELGKGKKGLLSLAFYPTDSFIFELYGDYEDRPANGHLRTLQAFLGYKTSRGRVGVQFAHQTRNNPNVELDGFSLFGTYKVSPRAYLFGRYDGMFDPNPEGAKIPYIPFDLGADSNLFIGGIDLRVIESFSLMPNFEMVRYGKLRDGIKPDVDFIPRVTFFYNF